MSDAIDYIAFQKSKDIQYIIAQIEEECNEVAVPYGLTMEKQNETTNQSEDTVL